MKSPFDIADKYLEEPEEPAGTAVKDDAGAGLIDGETVAVKVMSSVLGADIWLAFDEAFEPGDGLAVFYSWELPYLKNKTPEELKAICMVRAQFGGGDLWLKREDYWPYVLEYWERVERQTETRIDRDLVAAVDPELYAALRAFERRIEEPGERIRLSELMRLLKDWRYLIGQAEELCKKSPKDAAA